MNKIILITTTIFTLFFLQSAKANEKVEEVLIPTLNPTTGEIELRECPDYPLCPPARKSQELEETEEDDS